MSSARAFSAAIQPYAGTLHDACMRANGRSETRLRSSPSNSCSTRSVNRSSSPRADLRAVCKHLKLAVAADHFVESALSDARPHRDRKTTFVKGRWSPSCQRRHVHAQRLLSNVQKVLQGVTGAHASVQARPPCQIIRPPLRSLQTGALSRTDCFLPVATSARVTQPCHSKPAP